MVRFGGVRFDGAARLVEVDGEARHLEPQAFDVLAHLVEHRDRVVSKAELLDAVWGDQFVSESALTTRIKQVRRAVDDDGDRQAVIRNYRGRGYRFVAEVDSVQSIDGTAPPADDSILLGRAHDLEAVARHLGDCPLVTIVGPGGVGKTTLSRAVTDRVGSRFAGGVVFVELAPVRDSGDVVPALRRATGLTDRSLDGPALISAVAGLDALLVVDNCEHVLGAVTGLVDGITREPGATRVLATSRERLGLASEQVHPLAPLDDDAARALLVARARAARPDFAVAPGDDSAVEVLLTMVDRLPLAIEMAAARLGTIGVADLVAHLTGRVELLRSPNRSTDDRHRTVAALVEWSEALLDDETRALLAELSVFAGAVTADDIAAVVGVDATDLSLGPLADLVDHSLVVADVSPRPTRYRLLETVRAAVATRRDPSADARHGEFVLAAVREADAMRRGPHEAEGVARIDSLVEEIRVAHRWARVHDIPLAAAITTALVSYAQERLWAEPARWSREAIDAAGPGVDHSGFAASLASDAAHRGDYDAARSYAEQVRPDADPLVVASAHDTLANIGIYDGDTDASLRHGTALFALGEATGDTSIWTLGLLACVLAPLYEGRVTEARQELEERRPPGPPSPTSAAWTEYAEAEVLAAEGRWDEAIERFERSVAVGSAVRSAFVVSVAQTSLQAVRARAGGIGEALAEFATVLSQHRRTSGLTHGVTAVRNLIVLLVRAGEDEAAMVLLGALSDPAVKSTYGAESDLLDGCRASVEERRGAAVVSEWFAAGAAHDAHWALDHAIDVLDALV